jgi:hypothetical protein
MYANQLRINSWRLASFWIAMAGVAFAVPAQAQVLVQYTATLTTGFGDGPAIGAGDLTYDTANNGQPACGALNPGPPFSGALGSATEGRASFSGVGLVTTAGAAPRTVAFLKAGARAGLITTCLSSQTMIPGFLKYRIQDSSITWPGVSASFKAGGGFAGPTATPFVKVHPLNAAQRVTASTIGGGGGSPKFGGSIRVNGVSNAGLGIVGLGGSTWTGTLPVRLDIGAEGGTVTPTFIPAPVDANFHKLGGSTVLKGRANQMFFPWTTGKVIASDKSGNFWTLRTRSGFDNRNAAGTLGSLQLVSPAITDIVSGIAPLPFAITSVLVLTFTPEPGATLLLGAGVITLLGLHVARRRRG